MSKLLNPQYKPRSGLGYTAAQWDALKAKIQVYLDTKAADPTVDSEAVRALDPALRDDQVWAQISSDVGLVEIPEKEPPPA